MKKTLIITLLALALAGCKTSNPNAGAPPADYQTSSGEESGSTDRSRSNPGTFHTDGEWQQWPSQSPSGTFP
jgi:hypothetical protein